MSIQDRIFETKSRLKLYKNAEAAILSGQSYEVEGLKLTRANLKDVQSMIETLDKKLSALEKKKKGRTNFRVVAPGW